MDYDKEFQYKEELVEYAAKRGVSTEGTRPEITARLVAQDEINAAAAEDEAQAVSESDTPAEEPKPAPGTITAADLKVKQVSHTPDKDVTDEPAAEPKGDKVLVRMTKGANQHTFAGNVKFTRKSPFALVDAERAKAIVQMHGFREATASEAQAYYGE